MHTHLNLVLWTAVWSNVNGPVKYGYFEYYLILCSYVNSSTDSYSRATKQHWTIKIYSFVIHFMYLLLQPTSKVPVYQFVTHMPLRKSLTEPHTTHTCIEAVWEFTYPSQWSSWLASSQPATEWCHADYVLIIAPWYQLWQADSNGLELKMFHWWWHRSNLSNIFTSLKTSLWATMSWKLPLS